MEALDPARETVEIRYKRSLNGKLRDAAVATAGWTREPYSMRQFEYSAVKLSQGPLGIIALFLILIHALASLTLGLTPNIGPSDRSVIVWFLVCFPVVVLFVFAWLVSRHHTNLYPPQAFRDDTFFLRSAGIPYGQAGIDATDAHTRPQLKVTPSGRSLKAEAVGSLYWLGHDLLWAADVLLRKGPAGDVLIGLSQARHHLIQIGFEGTPIDGELRGLANLIQQSGELSPPVRDAFASQLGAIIDQIGRTIEAEQGDFKVPPHWNRVRDQAG